MKYLSLFENFENKSPLLDLSNNIDRHLIDEIKSLINSGSVLEISCGNGSDAIELDRLGYSVIATDSNINYVNHVSDFINCIKHDTRNSFPFKNKQFDLVYSRLGLHYFTKDELEKIFTEISRITKKYFIFSVKLTNNVQTGKVIFDKSTWEDLTNSRFKILKSVVKSGKLYDIQSEWLEVTAVKNN